MTTTRTQFSVSVHSTRFHYEIDRFYFSTLTEAREVFDRMVAGARIPGPEYYVLATREWTPTLPGKWARIETAS